MSPQLSATELQTAQELLQDYDEAQPAIATLQEHNGDLKTSLEDLIAAEAGTAVYGEERKTLREVFMKNLRREICGDDGFLAKVEEYNRKPGDAALLAGLIVYVIDVLALPFITPAIATVAVLWILKLGIRTFCDYTDPGEDDFLL